MRSKGLLKRLRLVIVGSIVCLSAFAQTESTEPSAKAKPINGNAEIGRHYFEGSKRFLNSGPACLSCHNVKNDKTTPGGLLAKDLTDVYDRMGEGLSGWLSAPPFPAMVSSYSEHPLTESERIHLTAFLKEVNDVKNTQTADSGQQLFIVGGGLGLLVMFLLIGLVWMKRKKQMVKREIFERQIRAWDAKH